MGDAFRPMMETSDSLSGVGMLRQAAAQTRRPSAASRRRTTITAACEACRKRKSKCDGTRPACYGCLSRETDCVYEGEPGETRFATLKSKNETMGKDIDSMLQLLSSLHSKPLAEAQNLLSKLRGSADITHFLRSTTGGAVSTSLKRTISNTSPDPAYDPSPQKAARESSATASQRSSTPISHSLSSARLDFFQTRHPSATPSLPTQSETPADEHGSGTNSPRHLETRVVDNLTLFDLPDKATFQEAIATFFSCSGKLYHVFTRAQVDRLYNDIFHNSKQSISKAALCELCSVAAVGTLYSQEAIPEGVGKLLYRVSKALLDDCIEANSLQASKVCSLLAQYTILTKATVALAYVEFGLSLARRNGVHSRYVPPGMSRDTWIDGKKAWRTLLFFGNWLSSTLGCISSDESLNSKMNLKDVEIDGERDIADLVQTEMAKIALLKVEIVRTNLAFKELSILSIKNITDDLRKWYTELPPAMYLANLTQHADIPAELRRTIYFVHLLYLGALMLLYRRVVCHYVQQDHRNMFINPLNEVSQYADQGVVAAKQTARILHLLRSEDGIFKRCWLVIFQANCACTLILHSIAQKQVHGFTADQWADDLEQAEKCLDALNFCAQVDQVAQGYHDALSPYYERFKRDYESQISSSPPGLSDLSTIDSVGSDHVVSPGPTPSSYLLTFPSKGSSHSAAAESLLDMVCKPFGSSANPTMEANAACGWSLDPDRCSAPPLVKSPRVKRESLAAPKWGGFYGVEHEVLATNMLGAIQQSR